MPAMMARLEGVHGGQGVAEGRPVDARYVGQAVAGGVRVRCCCHHPRVGAHVCTCFSQCHHDNFIRGNTWIPLSLICIHRLLRALMAGQILSSDCPYFLDTNVLIFQDYNLINTLTRGVEGGDSSRARRKLALGCSSLWEEDIMIIIIDLCPVTRVNMIVARTCVVEACDMRGEVTVYCCNPAPVTPDCDCTSCKGFLIFALGSWLEDLILGF